MRICDKCGSIQRFSEGKGKVLPPQVFGVCDRCGIPIPIEESMCAECSAIESIVIETPGGDKLKRGKRVALIIGVLAFMGTLGCVLAMAFAGPSPALIAGAVIFAIAFTISAVSAFVVFRQPKERIEVYPRYKPP
jgi:hypothetical protein